MRTRDETTHLSIKEWEDDKREEWKSSGSKKDFLPWLVDKAWKAEAQAEFEKENPFTEFTEEEFTKWYKQQIDQDLMLPKWRVRAELGQTDS